jgi:hypothetical protein
VLDFVAGMVIDVVNGLVFRDANKFSVCSVLILSRK